MCLIEYGTRLESINDKKFIQDEGLTDKLVSIDEMLTSNI